MNDDHTLAGNLGSLTGLARPALTDVPSVVDRLKKISTVAATLQPRGEDDGVACFSRLYQQITEDVLASYENRSLFRCGDFIIELDIAFAQRYLDAMLAHGTPGATVPGCWQLLFDRRQEDGIEPWRFAATGVNAHVNFDLAFALLDVWERHPDAPLGTTDEQYDDYRAINTIFERNMDSLCGKFDAPWSDVGGDGSLFDKAGNVLGDLLVVGTRDLAWTFAERMWRHHTTPGYRDVPTRTLDRVATGFARALI
ncbi:DUF5995 family protein [Actinomycetospora sp. C-140]